MNDDNYRFTVNSSWAINDDSVSIEEIITFENIKSDEWIQLTEENIGQLMPLDEEAFSSAQFKRQNNNEACSLRVNLEEASIKITKLLVISEARIIEFYGKHGEYLCTEKGYAFGKISGKSFYITQANISATKEITLKFCESNSETFCLYGITLFVLTSTETKYNKASINYSNVEEILRNSNIHLTENAERAKAFIKNYNFIKNNKESDLEDFQSLFEKFNNSGGNIASLISKLTALPPATNGNDNAVTTENGNNESDVNNLKHYIDNQLQQLEERVQNSLKLQLKEFEQKQNEKLDSIIQLLQK